MSNFSSEGFEESPEAEDEPKDEEGTPESIEEAPMEEMLIEAVENHQPQ